MLDKKKGRKKRIDKGASFGGAETPSAKGPLLSRSKVWIQDEHGNVVFGSGRLKILKAIKEKGSINAAAKELGIGYRAVWARIDATEKRLGKKLLQKQSGGTAGGGSQLTPLAETLIEKFGEIQNRIEAATDVLMKKELGVQLDVGNPCRANYTHDVWNNEI
ncbi:MAG: LysR family transcriptional regulator [Desulfatitalea sp.]|nr:LysR family transcriptional regulator [Desulfatitalea sp.]NNK01876.1 LysR family transcriptional regulator [Desulfatitalea sp.]